jgi:hypothetical protein
VTAKITLEQIDELLLAWDERLRRMDENLVALESEAIYQILAGKAGKRPALEGVTKERVGPALDAMTELFENRERLTAVVEKAKEVRASISALTFWESDEKMAEILRLLRGDSIELGQKVVALGERSLLDVGYHDVFIAPERLLAEMVSRFDQARKTLLAVSRAWESLEAELAQIEAKVDVLRKAAADLYPRTHGPFVGERPAELIELDEVESHLARLQARVARDPLGAEGTLRGEIGPRLHALAARLESAISARRRVQAALADARAALRKLHEDHARAVALVDRARRDLTGDSVDRLPAPLDEGLVGGLDAWLAKLEGTVEAQRWSPAEVGLARFHEATLREHGADAATLAAAEALVGRPGELSGRLSARRAQAAALASRGRVLPEGAEARAREAEGLLRQRPVPIDEATRAVEAYEAEVVALAARR